MPKLPSAEDFGVSLPQAARGVANVQPSRVGEAVSAIGNSLADMAKEETAKLNALTAQNALTELDNAGLDLAYGQDGYLHKKGMDVLNSQITKTYSEQYQAKITAIRSTLKTPEAQQMFDQHAGQRKNAFSGGVMKHAAIESDAAYDQAYKGRLDNTLNMAKADPGLLPEAIGKAEIAMAEEFKRLGITDKDTLASMRGRVIGGLASASLTLAVKNSPELAKKYLADYGRYLTPEESTSFANQIDAKETEGMAIPMGQAAYDMVQSGKFTETEAARWLQDSAQSTKNPKLFDAANHQFTQLLTFKNREANEKVGAVSLALMKGELNSKSLLTNTGFAALPPDDQAKLLKAAKDLEEQTKSRRREDIRWGWAQESHAREKDGEALFKPGVAERYFDLKSSNLAQKTPNEIAALLPVFGKQLTFQLMAEREQQIRTGNNYHIAPPTVQAAVAGISNAAHRKAALGLIEANLDAFKAANKGVIPTPQQEEQIIKNSMASMVKPGRLFGTNETPAYMVSPDRNDFYPVPRGTEPTLFVHKNVPKDYTDFVLAKRPNATAEQIAAAWNTELKLRTQGKK